MAKKRTFKVPAKWMTVTKVGPYLVVPQVNARCPTERVTKAWLFYRLMRGEKFISDHGDRAGAIMTAIAYVDGEPEE